VIYSLLRATARVALRWYYSNVTIVRAIGDENLARGPLLVVVNHPNALVDVLVAADAVPRRLRFTGKATLFSNPVGSALLKWLGVVPLRRASDEGGNADPSRNAESFEAITRSLADGSAVLIFPEGKSHDDPSLAPLKTGAARIALHGRDSGTVRGLRILPIGLVFEQKDQPRSRALAILGATIDVDGWTPPPGQPAPAALTAEIDARLRSLTLNYATPAEASVTARRASQIAALLSEDAPSVGEAGSLELRATVARAIGAFRSSAGDSATRARAGAVEARLDALQHSLDEHRVSLRDLAISRDVTAGTWFVLRELAVLLVAGPIALWGWLNHYIPFHAALVAGRRRRESAADPAMRTIVAGAAFVSAMYLLQGALVALIFGPWWAIAYVISLPIAADINLRFRERVTRALRRARTYLFFRANPTLHQQLLAEATALRAEILSLAG
jgi:1-acyl-sn-glycerol-3-phosphate acyltransferase